MFPQNCWRLIPDNLARPAPKTLRDCHLGMCQDDQRGLGIGFVKGSLIISPGFPLVALVRPEPGTARERMDFGMKVGSYSNGVMEEVGSHDLASGS